MAEYNDFIIGYKGSFLKTVTEEDNRAFAELSGDYNPIHFDDKVARTLGFPEAISNGFVTESRIAGALVETFGSEKTIVIALEKNTRFLKPVFMGDNITAEVEVVGRIEAMQALKIAACCVNQNYDRVATATMVILIKSRLD